MKLCKNCKYYKKIDYYDRCYHPLARKQSDKVSPIDGKPIFAQHYEACYDMRYNINGVLGRCNESGVLYEPNIFRKLLIAFRIVDE